MKLDRRQKIVLWGGLTFLLLLWAVAVTPLCVTLGLSRAPIATDVSSIESPPPKWDSFLGIEVPGGINVIPVVMTWAVMGLLILFSHRAGRNLRREPRRLQLIAESFVGMFDQLCVDSMGKEIGRKFVPYVATIFIFVLISNWIGVIPGLQEPTRDINTCFGLGLISFFVSHIAGIRYRGIKAYLREYFEPLGPLSPFLFVINVVGEIGKTLSHSLRLFGNVLGGAILVLVLGELTKQLPILNTGLSIWFGLFVGLVQAYVFAMLAMTYIAVKVAD